LEKVFLELSKLSKNIGFTVEFFFQNSKNSERMSVYRFHKRTKKARLQRDEAKTAIAIPLFFILIRTIIRLSLTQKIRVGLLAKLRSATGSGVI